MRKYKLYDIYENKERLLETDNVKALAKECRNYAEECENCCIFLLYKHNPETKKYVRINNWHYNKYTIVFD